MNDQQISDEEARLIMRDPYLEWVEREGLPVTTGLGINILEMDTDDWSRTETPAALAHLQGRGDFSTIIVIDIPPGKSTSPQRHLYEETVHVLAGHGKTEVEEPDGTIRSFEWGPKSVFAIPLNAPHRHFSLSGTEKVRMASTNNLPVMMKSLRDEAYIFGGSEFAYRGAFTDSKYFSGDGTFIPIRPGRHLWETNFVPDLDRLQLYEWKARGAGGSNVMLVMADSIMHSHVSEMPIGTYKKAHRHESDVYLWPLAEGGFTLLWYEGDEEFQRVDWQYGVTIGTPAQMFHQHFNTRPDKMRYLATGMGGPRFPFTDRRAKTVLGGDVSVKDGGRQIEYEDEDPRIRDIFARACRLNGHEPIMDDYFPG